MFRSGAANAHPMHICKCLWSQYNKFFSEGYQMCSISFKILITLLNTAKLQIKLTNI